MAKPYKEGSTWSVRLRRNGQDIYLRGFANQAAAKAEAARQVLVLSGRGAPKHNGPSKTSVAEALRLYGLERLPFLKGAEQEARRINKYLRAAGMAALAVSPSVGDSTEAPKVSGAPGPRAAVGSAATGRMRLFEVRIERDRPDASPPASLRAHRCRQTQQTADSDRLRSLLARTKVVDVTRHQVQGFMDALVGDGLKPATVALERAVLRQLFNWMRVSWGWAVSTDNPASGLSMPAVDNARTRVLSPEEQERLDDALRTCRDARIAPVLTLLRETAMRSSETLKRARWRDVDWSRCVLRLSDAKTGQREVPLSPLALEALRALQTLGSDAPDAPLVRLTYEALKAAWRRACERAGLEDLKTHDLRHTAATRMGLQTGNLFLVQALTGHKTLSQVMRYVNVKADDVVAVLHGAGAGAGVGVGSSASAPTSDAPRPPVDAPAPASNVIAFPGERRRQPGAAPHQRGGRDVA